MKVTCMQYDVNSFGITQRSLKMLRDVLANRIDHYVAVVKVPTNDLCCGYMIFDRDVGRAIWTGDGFRMDEQREGGAGYKSAKALLQLYGIRVARWPGITNFDAIYTLPNPEIRGFLYRLAIKIAEELEDSEFQRLSENNPQYIRG